MISFLKSFIYVFTKCPEDYVVFRSHLGDELTIDQIRIYNYAAHAADILTPTTVVQGVDNHSWGLYCRRCYCICVCWSFQSDIPLFTLTWPAKHSPNQGWESTHGLHLYPPGWCLLLPLAWSTRKEGPRFHVSSDGLSCLFGRRSKKTQKHRVTGLCVRNSPGTGEFLVQMASNAENVSIWWHHHDLASNIVFDTIHSQII